MMALSCALLAALVATLAVSEADASRVASPGEKLAGGFQDRSILGTAAHPIPQAVTMRFAPDGEVFAAGEDGRVWEYQNLDSRKPTLVADLSGDRGGNGEVMDWVNRGLLGLAIDPAYPVRPYLYLLYSYNAPPGRRAPYWPFDRATDTNRCPTPPGPATPKNLNRPKLTNGDGCLITGRLSRITIDLRTHRMVPGSEVPLIKDQWCDQSWTHSIGDLRFAPDGSLYVSGGSGGIWGVDDYGEIGGSPGDPITPKDPCADPTANSGPGPGHPGVTIQPAPSDSKDGISGAEGGMLRSQSFRRPLDQPASLDGTIVRVDPATGRPMPDNPNHAMSDLNRRRIVAYGLRQPFRFIFGPSTNSSQLWIGEVGEETVEEVDRDPHPLRSPSFNFGWPCYEGYLQGPEYRGVSYYKNFSLCAPTVHSSDLVFPFYTYRHFEPLYPGDPCNDNLGSSITGLAFVDRKSPYPRRFNGALMLADYSRQCLWALLPDKPGSLPDPRHPGPVAAGRSGARADFIPDLETGPDHAIYYVNLATGALHRLGYRGWPQAVLVADKVIGPAPLTVHFSSEGSSAPHPGPHFLLAFGDSSTKSSAGSLSAAHTYTRPGLYTASLTILDRDGHRDTTRLRIAVGPVLSGVRIAHSTLRLMLLESAQVRVTIEKRVRSSHGTTLRRIGSTAFAAQAGENARRLSTLLPGSSRRLSPGSYRLTVAAYYGGRLIAPPARVP